MLKQTELKSYTKLSARQVHECAKLLEQHLEALPDGLFKYRNGGSDAKLAEMLKFGESQVKGVRRSVFGHLRGRGPLKKLDRVAGLEARIEHLERWATDRKHMPFERLVGE